MTQLNELWRYPLKSAMGEQLSSVALTDHGVLGDRGWAPRDEVRGGIRGAKKIGALMKLAAQYVQEPTLAQPVPHAAITLPGGDVVRTDAADVNERVSTALDHRVTLFPLQPPEALDHYRRGGADTDDFMEELRTIFGREADEPLPDLSKMPPIIFEYESPPGTYFDAFPLLLVTRQSLASIGADVRRFRPNLVIDAPESSDSFPELAWVGRTLRIGDAEVKIETECPRCVMVTRAFAELDEDRSVLRRVVRDADQNLGVYATVTTPGTVTVGDKAQLL
jgi:uncharacterized protein YcbX